MKDKRMISELEKYMLDKRAYADVLKEPVREPLGLIEDLPKSRAIKAAEASEEFAEKRGKDIAKQAAREGSMLKNKALGKISSKMGGKGLARLAGLVAGPIGLLVSGGVEAADSPSAGPFQGSDDERLELMGLTKEALDEGSRVLQQQSMAAKKSKEREERAEKIRNEGLSEMIKDKARYQDVADSMDTRSVEEKEKDAERRKALMKLRSRIGPR